MDGLASGMLGFQVPRISIPEFKTPFQDIWADKQFEILKEYIADFENGLDDEHEVGLMLASFGQTVTMRVRDISYEEPVLMVFKGEVDGNNATLIQHVSQLNFLLTSIRILPEKTKRPIGFSTGNDNR